MVSRRQHMLYAMKKPEHLSRSFMSHHPSPQNTSQKKRVLLKLSGELLSNTKMLSHIVAQISTLKAKIDFAFVVGGGNVLRGRETPYACVPRAEVDTIGMCASVLNSLLFKAALTENALKAKVFTPFTMQNLSSILSNDALYTCTSDGVMPIFAGGTGHPFVSTDTAAVLYALRFSCDRILKGTRVNGLFDKDPETHKDAKLLPHITHEDALAKPCALLDSAAIALARDHALPLTIFNVNREKGLELALCSVQPLTQVVCSKHNTEQQRGQS